VSRIATPLGCRARNGEPAEFRDRIGSVDQEKPLSRVRFAPETLSECQ
jgi:hypothetical protein